MSRKTINGKAGKVHSDIIRKFQSVRIDADEILGVRYLSHEQAEHLAKEIRAEMAKADAAYFGALSLWGPQEEVEQTAKEINAERDREGVNCYPSSKPLACCEITRRELIDNIRFISFVIPNERFVEYEPSDLGWMEYFGLVKYRPQFDTVVLPQGTMIKRSEAGTMRVCESPYCPDGVGYLVNTRKYAL